MLLQVTLQAAKVGILHLLVPFNFKLGLGEDQHFEVTVGCDELSDEGLLGRVVLAEHDLVADGVWHLHLVLAYEVEHKWLVHVLASDLLNVGWHCGREDHRLGLGHEPLDADDLLLEAHV